MWASTAKPTASSAATWTSTASNRWQAGSPRSLGEWARCPLPCYWSTPCKRPSAAPQTPDTRTWTTPFCPPRTCPPSTASARRMSRPPSMCCWSAPARHWRPSPPPASRPPGKPSWSSWKWPTSNCSRPPAPSTILTTWPTTPNTAPLRRITEFWTRLGTNERLYAKYKAIAPASLTPVQSQAHRNAMRNFVLAGAELTGAAKERFACIQQRQAELDQKFSENVLDATEAFAYYASAEELDGLPADIRQAALSAAQAEGRAGYKLTLKSPSYLPVMQFPSRSELRENLYRAYVTRASDQAENRQFDNSASIAEILALRREEARLLGYPHFGALSITPKITHSPAQP